MKKPTPLLRRFTALTLALLLSVGDPGLSLLSEAAVFARSDTQIVTSTEADSSEPGTEPGGSETGTEPGGSETGTEPGSSETDTEAGTDGTEAGSSTILPEVEEPQWNASAEGGEDLTWSAEDPADLTFTIRIEPEAAPVTAASQTLELSLTLPEPFAFADGESV